MLPKHVPFRCLSHAGITKGGVGSSQESCQEGENMRPIHWIIVLVVVLVLFGAQKLPDLARSIGKSAKILKEEMNDLSQDSSSASDQASTSQSENTDSSK